MTKVVGKEIPWEKQRDMLVEMTALKAPTQYQSLIKVYGPEKGKAIYEEVYEENFKLRAARFEGKNIGDILMAEIDMFPAMGWKLWVEKVEENGADAWYEHLEKCPHLAATRKYKLPDPCPLLCDMDCALGEKYKVAHWERIKHMPAGDDECCFRITRCP
jgi:hypothetical protein